MTPASTESYISQYEYSNIQINENDKTITLPRSISMGLFLAIIGHSFWSGTSFLSGYFAQMMGLGFVGEFLVSIAWTVVLVTGILFIGSRVLESVAKLP